MSMTPTSQLLQMYEQAEAAILQGQSFRRGDRELRLPDLEFVQAKIRELRIQLARELRAASGQNTSFSQASFG